MSPYTENWTHLTRSSLDLSKYENKPYIPETIRISRIGRLLQHMILILRIRASPLNAARVRVKDGNVIVEKRKRAVGDDADSEGRMLKRYVPKCDDMGAWKIGSLKGSGFEALVYLYSALKVMLDLGISGMLCYVHHMDTTI